jgi:hypothetical protein
MYRPPQGKYNYFAGKKDIEVCSFLNLLDPKSPLGWLTGHMQNLTHGLIHSCPYLPGLIELKNFTTAIRDYPMMKNGDFKTSAFLRDDIDPNGVNVTWFFSVMIRGDQGF